MSAPRRFYCDDLRKIGKVFDCCSSCHADWDEGYVDLMNYHDGEDVIFICCSAEPPTKADWAALRAHSNTPTTQPKEERR